VGPLREGDLLQLAAAPRHLVRIQTSSPRHAAAARLSADARFIAAADCERTRLFALTHPRQKAAEGGPAASTSGRAGGGDAAWQVQRVKLAAGAAAPAVALAFSLDGGTLYAAAADGSIRAVGTASGALEGRAPPPSPPPGGAGGAAAGRSQAAAECRPAVSHLEVSPDGRWLAAARPAGVQLLRLPGLEHGCWVMEVGRGGGGGRRGGGGGGGGVAAPAAAALAFSPDSSCLAVAGGGGALAAYDVASGAPTQWTLAHGAAAGGRLKSRGVVLGLDWRGGRGGMQARPFQPLLYRSRAGQDMRFEQGQHACNPTLPDTALPPTPLLR
jgi:hypothetical protein